MAESFAAGLVGIVLDGRYRLDALLGEGGMGAVYRAHHLAMDRKVAVKLLKPHLTSDDAALQRFAREARATMKVDSEHAVKLLDFGREIARLDSTAQLEVADGSEEDEPREEPQDRDAGQGDEEELRPHRAQGSEGRQGYVPAGQHRDLLVIS